MTYQVVRSSDARPIGRHKCEVFTQSGEFDGFSFARIRVSRLSTVKEIRSIHDAYVVRVDDTGITVPCFSWSE